MISLKILDIKHLMQILLYDSEPAFDDFLLSEATVKMAATFSVDGHINKEFFEEDTDAENTSESNENMVLWKSVKSNFLNIIKGKKTPSSFNIVLYLQRSKASELIGKDSHFEDVSLPGLMLRLSYSGSELYALTGTVNAVFTLDKSIDILWDNKVKEFFTNCRIPFDEQ